MVFHTEDKNLISIKNIHRIEKRIRIDPFESENLFKLYEITIHNYVIGKRVFSAQDIFKTFRPNSQIARFELIDDYVLIQSNGLDPALIADIARPAQHHLYALAIAIFISFVAVELISRLQKKGYQLSTFPAFADIDTGTTGNKNQIMALNGLRGLATLFVLAEHATKTFDGLGGVGVCIFFSLSGFLLTKPFLKNPDRILSWSFMRQYMIKRIKRIMPMYFSYLFCLYFLTFHFGFFFRHIFFIQGAKHLWTMPQEMFFYMLLPFILLSLYCISKIKNKGSVIVFFLFSMIFMAHSEIFHVRILHNDGHSIDLIQNISVFLAGMLFCHLVYYFIPCKEKPAFHLIYKMSGTIGLLTLILFCLLATKALGSVPHAITYPFYFHFLGGFLIFCIVINNDSLFNKILSNKILRAVGLVSFSFYIIHYKIIHLILFTCKHYFAITPNEFTLTITAGVSSYFIASITYTFIERPFIRNSGYNMSKDFFKNNLNQRCIQRQQ
jgi:peptidoglycan/LPS O-acetylase OafA/YrhL